MHTKRISDGVSETEWLPQVRQPVASLRHGAIRLVVRGARIVPVEPTQQPLFGSNAQSTAKAANVESFITDWADS